MNAHPAGFDPERVLVMKVQLSGVQYRDVLRQRAYADELLRRLRSTPGVEAASLTTPDARTVTDIVRASVSPERGQIRQPAVFNVTSAGTAKVMGMRVVRGRWITDAEPSAAVVINESLARYEFGAGDSLGTRFRVPGRPGPERPVFATIVGVVADVKYSRLDANPEPEFYIPYRHGLNLSRITVMVKTAGDPLIAAPSIRQLVSEIDKAEPAFDVLTLEQALAESIAPRRFNLFLLGAFAAPALLLALIGIYGVISYSVAQRTHEIGVRMALGAQRAEVVRMVVRRGLGMALAGIVTGLAAAFALTRVMTSLLYDVKPTDPPTFAAVAAVLSATALAACWGPALKAAFVDPVIALRYE